MALTLSGLRSSSFNVRNGYSYANIGFSVTVRDPSTSHTDLAVVFFNADTDSRIGYKVVSIKAGKQTSVGSGSSSVAKQSELITFRAVAKAYTSYQDYLDGADPIATSNVASQNIRAYYTADVNLKDSRDGQTLIHIVQNEGRTIGIDSTQEQLESLAGKKWDHWNTEQDESGTEYTSYNITMPGSRVNAAGLVFDYYAFWKAGVNVKVKVDGTWEEGELKAKVNGEWVDAEAAYVKVNGAWIEIN